MKKAIISLCASAVFLLAACSSDEPNINNENKENKVPGTDQVLVQYSLTDAEALAASKLDGFNNNYFGAVNTKFLDKNVVCSPLSASLLLASLANAADQNIANEIIEALGCNDIDALNSYAAKVMTALPTADPAVTMSLANSVWYEKSLTLNPDFIAASQNYFNADIFDVDFKHDATVGDKVNTWVDEKTNGFIKEIVKEINPKTVAILANALYFKGAWANPFEASATEIKPFNGLNGTTSVNMMHACQMQHWCQNDQFSAVMMEFGNGMFEAVLALPVGDVNNFIASDGLKSLSEARFIDSVIDFSFPRFAYQPEEDIKLNEILPLLNVNSFDTDNLNMFMEEVPALFKIAQKANITFNEEGAEGAAVTWVAIDGALDEPAPVPVIRFDHPFIFLIREHATGNTLFAGKIVDL